MAVEIVLYQPEIPPNTGNIARTCALTGTKLHLIRPLGFSLDEKSLKRAGLDYWHLLDVEVHDSLEAFLDKYGEENLYFSTTKAQRFHTEVNYEESCMIVFGSETKGLPASLHEEYEDRRIKIPMLNKEGVRSLNLSNSVNIVLYEVLRQLDYKQLKG